MDLFKLESYLLVTVAQKWRTLPLNNSYLASGLSTDFPPNIPLSPVAEADFHDESMPTDKETQANTCEKNLSHEEPILHLIT